ncbi:MAG: 3'-5' exonuclease [Peptococcaceae bacterium]|nr:3'-5' exonuclease [Peptococcaceae bacterium]
MLGQVEGIKKLFPLGWFNRDIQQPDADGARKLERFRDLVKKNDYRQKDNIYLREMKLVVLDTETTGLKPQAGDEIISVGACLVRDGKVLPQVFHRLVNPGRPIPPFITELTGISDEMVAGEEDFCTVMADFLDFLQDSVIIGHSIDFDINFMNYKLKPYSVRINNFHVDTGMLSRALNPQWKIHTLDSILSNLGIDPEGRHTALGDALLTARVFLKFFEHFEDLRVLTLWDLRCFLRNAVLYRL